MRKEEERSQYGAGGRQWARMCSGQLGLNLNSDQGLTSWSGTFDGGKGKDKCIRVMHWQSRAPA